MKALLSNIYFYIFAASFVVISILSLIICEKNKKLAKLQEKEIEDKVKELNAKEEVHDRVNNSYVQGKGENEELEKKMVSDDLDGFNAGVELMHKLEESGKQRNGN